MLDRSWGIAWSGSLYTDVDEDENVVRVRRVSLK